MGGVLCIQGAFARATAHYWESLLWFEDEQHSSGTRNYPLRNLGFMVLLQGDDQRVLALLQQAVAWYREKGGDQIGLGLLTHMVGAVLYRAGEAEAGLAIVREAPTLQLQRGQTSLVRAISELLTGSAHGQGQTVQATRPLGATSGLRRVHRQPG
jgi:hypothetical protein